MYRFNKIFCVGLSILLLVNFHSYNVFSQDFTSVADGAWESNLTWGEPAGAVAGVNFPSRTNSVSIGHNVTIDATNDNGSTAEAPNSLGINEVCGAGCLGTCNTPTGCNTAGFSQEGTITVTNGGTLTTTVPSMFKGDVTILSGGSADIQADVFILALFDAQTGATSVAFGDDVVISADGVINFDVAITVVDDLYLDGDNAGICGNGSMTLGGGGSDIRVWNTSDEEVLDQFCDNVTVTCSDGNCCDTGAGNGDCPDDLIVAADTGGGGEISPAEGTGDEDVILPIDLIFFRVNTNSDEYNFTWATASEIDNAFFTIEGSNDGKNWTSLTEVEGAGTSNIRIDYEHLYSRRVSLNYFRLKQTDFDGQYSYSYIVSPRSNNESYEIEIFPNPTSDFATILMKNEQSIQKIRLISMDGRIVKSMASEDLGSSKILIPVNHLENGIYAVIIDLYNGSKHTSTIKVQK
ncbi:MAG: T9SS type A sorting domain-containing protein [Reichenbachiella sp.]